MIELLIGFVVLMPIAWLLVSFIALLFPSYQYEVIEFNSKCVIRRYNYFRIGNMWVYSIFSDNTFNYISDFHKDGRLTSHILAKEFESKEKALEYVYELKSGKHSPKVY